MLTRCLMMAKGFQYSIRSSSLLQSYGCLEKTNVTVILPRTNNVEDDNLYKLMKVLEDPCNTIFYFAQQSQKVIQWKGDRNEFVVHHMKSSGEPEYMDFILNLRDHQFNKNDTTTQILLIHYIQLSDQALKILEVIHKETPWKIIITCSISDCPIIPDYPMNRMVPIRDIEDTESRLRDLVRNPDFSKFEFLKYIKLDNVNLKCLANKTIHIFHGYPSLKLFENVALIAYNIRELSNSTKIILYFPKWKINNKFWKSYLEKSGLNNIMNIKVMFVQQPPFEPLTLHETEADVYIINDITITLMFMSMEHFCGRKSAVFYGSLQSSTWYDNWHNNYFDQTCKKNFKKVTFKYFETKNHLEENFIEEVLNTSCF